MNVNKCCLCSQIIGDANNDLFAKLIKARIYIRRVAFESKNFAVIPSLGPLTPGHVLLCPKSHYKSFASIPSSYEPEFFNIKNKLKNILETIYNKPIHCFEHGTAKKATQPLCTVEHAHLHFIPARIKPSNILKNVKDWKNVGGKITDLNYVVKDFEYIYYESPQGECKVTVAKEGTFESQFLRKIFANALGRDNEWNWREVPNPIIAHETFENILVNSTKIHSKQDL